MSTIQGINGAYSGVTGFNAKMASWTANINIDNVETTGFSSNGYRDREPVIVHLDGNASGTGEFDASSTAPTPSALLAGTAAVSNAKGSMTLTATTGCTLAFTGVMQQVGLNRPNDGKLDVNHSFVSSGAITQTWDETA